MLWTCVIASALPNGFSRHNPEGKTPFSGLPFSATLPRKVGEGAQRSVRR